MRVLITGHRGFIGRHFLRHYREEGHDVYGVDIADGTDCRYYFNAPAVVEGEWDLVIHCAAVIGGRAGIDADPLGLMAENLSIDAALFRWALRARPKRIVYFSSCARYDVEAMSLQRPIQIGENLGWLNRQPFDVYGHVKKNGELMAAQANAAGIKTHVFRPFSGYGSDQSLDYPFPRFIERAVNGDDPFEVWGDMESTRDWVHVDDIVGCVLAAIDRDVLGPVNICTGRATTFRELARKCMDEAGYEGAIVSNPHAPTGAMHRVGDPTLMHQFYRPRITLEEGIARAIEARRADRAA